MDYRREVDGLRALAVLPVILFHAGLQTFSGGFVGVDVFFVISGYLITSIILAEKQAGTFTLAGFYERRARRILPALYLVAAVCIPFAYLWLLPNDLVDFSQSLIAVAGFASNILFWRETGYFEAASELKPLLHTWSLAVEEQYYLIFPVLFLAAWRLGRRWLVVLMAAALLVSLGVAQWGVSNRPAATFFLLPTRGWELLIGALAAFYLSGRSIHPNRLREIPACAGLLLLAYGVLMFDAGTPFPGLYALVPTIGAVLIIIFADSNTYAGRLLGSRILVGIGLISYSAYLWHQPVLAFAKHRFGEIDHLAVAIVLSLTFLLAVASWRYVEQPFRSRTLIGRKPMWSASAAGAAVLVACGWVGFSQNGFIDHYAPEDRYLLEATDHGGYVTARARELAGREFDSSGLRKVVLIGDSFGQDITNAVYESGLNESMQISTFHIRGSCGNLFVQEDFSDHVPAADLPTCGPRYQDPQLKAALEQADEIWLASSWRYWQAELLPESVENLKRQYGSRVLVFGRKNFGNMARRDLVGKTRSERLAMSNPMHTDHVKTNALMRATLAVDNFIDVSAMMCQSETVCRLFTPNDRLISYDGEHLTADGAKYLGHLIQRHSLVTRSLTVYP